MNTKQFNRFYFLLIKCTFLFFVNIPNEVFAQKSVFFKQLLKGNKNYSKLINYSSLSIGAGSSHFYGDVGSSNILKSTINSIRWNVGVSYARTLTKNVLIGANFSYISIASDDINAGSDLNYIRNLHFRNDIKQFSAFVQYHPFSYSTDFRKRIGISPYLTGGIGYFFHNPQTKLPISMGSEWVNLQPLHTEGQGINEIYSEPYKLSGFCIPLGLGIKYRLNKTIDLAFEVSYKYTFTDYLDDVSGIYPNPILFSDKTAVVLSNRSREPFSANTGEDRSVRLISYLEQNGEITAQPFLSNNPAFGAIGNNRGSKLGNDAYLTTNFQIHFLFPNSKNKCPRL